VEKMVGKYIKIAVLAGVLALPAGLKAQGDYSYPDDPIAAMLDSLVRLNIFEKSAKPFDKNNKYNFPIDSIPMYSDAVIAQRLAKLDAQSPFDLVYNDQVKGYINMYAVRKRVLVSKVLGLSEMYFPMFEESLAKYGLPLELKYLAVIESALNPSAKSRAGAMGLWQFMYQTGKMYGLKVTSYEDQRCDPRKATDAACEYLQFLFETFGDWQMALAAYNCGPGNINKAIRRSGGKKTYWEIRPYLPRETQGYVPSFIAVNYVMSYAAEHNLYAMIPRKTFFQVDTVHIKNQLSFEQISKVLDISIEDLEYLNPRYKKHVIPYNAESYCALTLPVSKVGSFITNETAIYKTIKEDSLLQQLVTKEVMKIHTVKSGEKINSIANKYKCTVADIMAWNNLSGYKLKAGTKLTVYVPVKSTTVVNNPPKKTPPTVVKNQTVNNTPTDGKYKYHTIQKGDSLWTVAQAYGTTVEQIKKLNGIQGKYMLHPGQKIKVGTDKG
jgi:membrane-bound lytic murein transglycosylase D